MTAKKSSTRFRVGRVSYYQHHGSWYLYYRDNNRIHRLRIGRSETEAERAAALKNAELTAGEVSISQQPALALPLATDDGIERRSWVTNAAALLVGMMELGRGLQPGQVLPAFAVATIDVPAQSLKPVTSGANLREEFIDHHEHVLASSLGTAKRYSSATQHLVNYAEQEGITNAVDVVANKPLKSFMCFVS